MANIQLKNNAYSTTASGVSALDTSFSLASGTGTRFPSLSGSQYFYAVLEDAYHNIEIVKVTGITGDVVTVTRAQEGTTAKVFPAASAFELRLTAQTLADYVATGFVTMDTTTGAANLPYGTTAQRPTSPTAGAVRINSTLAQLEWFDGASWAAAGYAQKQIQSVTASVASNALTLGLNPTSLDFRSSVLTNGAPNTRTVQAALSLVVPSGATLGTVSGQAARLVILAVDNAGTVELAVTNLAGGVNLDETTLINTTAISAAATSASVIYSASARTGVPFRVVGFGDVNQVTAGTWATAPTTIQGQGGQALAAMQALGYGQSWQDVSVSRAFGTIYYNTTGKPIQVLTKSGGSATIMTPTVGGLDLDGMIPGSSGTAYASFIVPSGQSYKITYAGSSATKWYELR